MTDRTLGPELVAEGWRVIGGDWIDWLHVPTKRVVTLDDCVFSQTDSPAYPCAPADKSANGYIVGTLQCDDEGNPIKAIAHVWIESYATALRVARTMRQAVLDEYERGRHVKSTQLNFDDLLARIGQCHVIAPEQSAQPRE